jgi:1-deoxy-D-xylulose-5-phosphate synthase
MAPANENECRQMLFTAFQFDGPSSVRYPRGKGPGVELVEAMEALPIAKAELIQQGSKVALLAFGTMVEPAKQVADKHGYTIVNMRFVKPLDTTLIESLANSHDLLITLEENSIAGGAGAGVMEHLSDRGIATPVRLIGLPDEYIEHGTREELLSQAKLDLAGIEEQISAAANEVAQMLYAG